jgi:pyruvate ferredoxin oxidoreductase beta subunit
VVNVSKIRKWAPVEDYLRLQSRYAHLFQPGRGSETIARLQAIADRNITRFGLLEEGTGREQAVRHHFGCGIEPG